MKRTLITICVIGAVIAGLALVNIMDPAREREERRRAAIAEAQLEQARIEAEARQQRREDYADVIADQRATLADIAAEEGVTVLPSGLMYRMIEEGSGASPGPTDSVRVHYAGTFLGGGEFDSSYKRGEPAVFGVTQVIRGWTESLQLMKEGSKWQIYVPYELAYGEEGRPPYIPPFSALIFEIELLEVLPPSP